MGFDNRFDNQVWLVSGASSGIGLKTAQALLAGGARVAFAARSVERLRPLVAASAAGARQAAAVPLDVTSDASVHGAVRAVLDAFGRIDGLINMAGNGGLVRRWDAAEASHLREMFAVHVFGAERMVHAVLPTMRRQGSGTIVNIASAVAWVPMPGAAAYSAAKAAVVSWSAALRAELQGSGIDVRVFAPPHTRTDAGVRWPLPLPRIFEPEWVAGQLVRSLQQRAPLTIPGGNRSLLWLQRLSPALASRVMNRIGFTALERVGARPAGEA
ncbi:MAG: 2-(R)-hydroxypropyl-CoM dehydrogenase [Burkholderiaceae bacterium]|nr:2-(R)-hydroxypropyl-CoM dehydrogenase [Burkholderiaceae bacterium]